MRGFSFMDGFHRRATLRRDIHLIARQFLFGDAEK